MSSSRTASARSCPAARGSRSATSTRLEARAAREGRRRVHRRADPGAHGHDAAGRLPAGRAGRSAAATARCSSPTRSRPGSGAPASGSHSSTGGSSRTVVLVGKALSGGYMPVAAMVTTREIYQTGGRDARALLRASVDVRAQPPVDGGGPRHAARDRTRRARRARRGASAAFCATGLAELRERHELIKEIRGLGLMIGIELGPPRGRAAKLNWHLIHMRERGSFPAADRDPAAPRSRHDHDGGRQERRDQAAAAADALARREARELPRRARRRAARLPGRVEQELGGRTRHRDGDACAVACRSRSR